MRINKIPLLVIISLMIGCKATDQSTYSSSNQLLEENIVGGDVGKRIEDSMDQQANELRKSLDAKIERIGEGILITFNNGLLFDTNSSYLREESKENLQALGKILSNYADTHVVIEGHTDSTGEDKYNQWLSEKRSNSVKAYLATNGVLETRMKTLGYGESRALQENSTAEGRQANRRVEVIIYANSAMIDKNKSR
jgi:outer membrane protein OmpA-like peptidoglycan-associated protein